MKAKRIISAALAGVMLSGSGAVNTLAYSGETNADTSGYVYSTRGLAAPKILGASKSSSKINLRWSKVKGASGYKIYRKTTDGKYKCIKTVQGGGTLSYKLTGFNSNTKYKFKLRAYKMSGGKTTYSNYSPAKTVTTKYGLGKTNYTNEALSVNFDTKIWELKAFHRGPEEFGRDTYSVRFIYKGETYRDEFDYVMNSCYGWISSEKVNEDEKDKKLEDFVDDFVELAAEVSDFYDVEYGKIDGCRCAYLTDINKGHGYSSTTLMPLVMVYKDGYLTYLECHYEPDDKNAKKFKKAGKEVYNAVRFA